jgi:uncharacterized repeat protein (TIGR03806 family)
MAAARRPFAAALAGVALALAACGPQETPRGPNFDLAGLPENLSEWGVLRAHDGVLELAAGAQPYDLATPLFSDYAQKLRTISLPPGTAATFSGDGDFALPVGTILTKTFYYESDGAAASYGADRNAADGLLPLSGLRLVETRVLARREEGWIALPYVWNADMTEATLKRTGALIALKLKRPDGREEPLNYFVPNANQCASCHATDHGARKVQPIGIKARHLDKPSSFAAGVNQLDHWRLAGLLIGDFSDARPVPANASWTDEGAPLDARARAYLDANCSHCHSDVGPADTSGLDLRPDVAIGPKAGLCKSTIAAGPGTGGRTYDIAPGRPDESILVYRMETNDPAAMMPEIGRSVVHEEGVALIREWIASMAGSCS